MVDLRYLKLWIVKLWIKSYYRIGFLKPVFILVNKLPHYQEANLGHPGKTSRRTAGLRGEGPSILVWRPKKVWWSLG
jgi:hypothetical protein